MLSVLALASLLSFINGRPAAGEVEFLVEPHVELLAVLSTLAGSSGADEGYAAEVRSHFAPYKEHPAVARAAALARVDPAAALRAAQGADADFLDFVERSRFSEFFAARAPVYRRWRRAAEREARRAQSPDAVARYLGEAEAPRLVFALSGALPRALETEGGGVVVRSAERGDAGLSFGFGSFGRSAAHQLVHAALRPRLRRLALAGPAPEGCGDARRPSWTACFDETLAFAVTLRARSGRSEPPPRGLPQLSALTEALARREREKPARPLSADLPALEDAFRLAAGGAPRSPAEDEAERLKESGLAAFRERRLDDAVAAFRGATARSLGDAEAWLDLGVALQENGAKTEALAAYDRAVAIAEAGGDAALSEAARSSRESLIRGGPASRAGE